MVGVVPWLLVNILHRSRESNVYSFLKNSMHTVSLILVGWTLYTGNVEHDDSNGNDEDDADVPVITMETTTVKSFD